jgi:hypothetical protein
MLLRKLLLQYPKGSLLLESRSRTHNLPQWSEGLAAGSLRTITQ